MQPKTLKTMKKIEMFAIAAVAVCVMASCDGKKSNKTWSQEEDLDETELVEDDEEADEAEASNEIDVAPDELWTEEAVSDVLRRAYADVSTVFTPQEDGLEANIDLDGTYCTEQWNETLRKVRAASYRKTRNGKEGFNEIIHWNYWMEGRVTPEDIHVTLLTGNMAEATFRLTHGEEWMHTRVSLWFENGQWRISDWLEVGDDSNSLLMEMEKYAEQKD